MDFKSIIDEAKSRSEKIRREVLNEVLRSKTLQEIASNKHFVSALARVIQTKDEVKKALGGQIQSMFESMEVPSREDLMKLANKLGSLENLIERVGRSSIAVKILPSLKTTKATPSKRATRKASPITKAKKTAKKTSRKTKKTRR